MEVIEPSRSRSSVTSSASVSKRTGTSNSKLAVTRAPGAGTALAAMVTSDYFNRIPADGHCGPDAYAYPAVFDPWVTSDADPERRRNGPGDAVTAVMLLVVTGVGTLIHIYAIGYMREDVRHKNDVGRFPRFFIYLNLFIAMMMILVSGDSYLMLFVGWEGVGLCSYLMIGFWF